MPQKTHTSYINDIRVTGWFVSVAEKREVPRREGHASNKRATKLLPDRRIFVSGGGTSISIILTPLYFFLKPMFVRIPAVDILKGTEKWAPQMGILLVGLAAGNIWFDFWIFESVLSGGMRKKTARAL